jgi:hypothetical protein
MSVQVARRPAHASEEPVCTPEAQRLDVDRHAAELHAQIRVAMATVDGR